MRSSLHQVMWTMVSRRDYLLIASAAEGRLELADTPMADVARQLERWYDVRVIVSDSSLARFKVSASVDRDAELGTVVRVLAASLDARATSQGRTVHFDIAN